MDTYNLYNVVYAGVGAWTELQLLSVERLSQPPLSSTFDAVHSL